MYQTEVCSRSNGSLAQLEADPTTWGKVIQFDNEKDACRKALELREGEGWPVVRVRDKSKGQTILIMQRLAKRQKRTHQ